MALTCLHPAAPRAAARRSDRPADPRDEEPRRGSRHRVLPSGRDRSALPGFLHRPLLDADTGSPASVRWPQRASTQYCRRPEPDGPADVKTHGAATARRSRLKARPSTFRPSVRVRDQAAGGRAREAGIGGHGRGGRAPAPVPVACCPPSEAGFRPPPTASRPSYSRPGVRLRDQAAGGRQREAGTGTP